MSTVLERIRDAAPGAVVDLPPGEHRVNLVLDRPVHLRGRGPQTHLQGLCGTPPTVWVRVRGVVIEQLGMEHLDGIVLQAEPGTEPEIRGVTLHGGQVVGIPRPGEGASSGGGSNREARPSVTARTGGRLSEAEDVAPGDRGVAINADSNRREARRGVVVDRQMPPAWRPAGDRPTPPAWRPPGDHPIAPAAVALAQAAAPLEAASPQTTPARTSRWIVFGLAALGLAGAMAAIGFGAAGRWGSPGVPAPASVATAPAPLAAAAVPSQEWSGPRTTSDIVPPPPPASGQFDLKDLKVQASQARWAVWLAEMKAAFREAQAFERDAVASAAVMEAWSRFLTAYALDDPYSDEDEQMRATAAVRRDAARPAIPAAATAAVEAPATSAEPPIAVRVAEPEAVPADYAALPCGGIVQPGGATWVVGPDRDTSVEEAASWAESLRACGQSDWRLPTVAELKSLFDVRKRAGTGYQVAGRFFPARVDPAFGAIGGGSWVWSRQRDRQGRPLAMNFWTGRPVVLESDGRTVQQGDGATQATVRAFAVRARR